MTSRRRFCRVGCRGRLRQNPMKYILGILASALLFISPVISQSKPAEGPILSDQAAMIRERTPDLPKFYELLRKADRVVVTDDSDGKQVKLFESSEESDLAELRAALRLDIPEVWHESICPNPDLAFYKGPDLLMTVSNALGSEVKTSVWSGNAVLVDPEKWLAWFSKHGMPQVRDERDRVEADAKKYEADERRWYAAMPRGIREPFDAQRERFGLPSMHDASAYKAILEKEYPKKNDRILALLHWFGSGEGSWNGYPAYESIAQDILFSFTTREILDAIESRKLSSTETEGAARLFAGWDYEKKRPDDLKLIPPKVRKRLLEHSMKSPDPENRDVAKKVFAN